MSSTLGSLFDGIGGFPFVARMYGIEPIWASEIEKQHGRCAQLPEGDEFSADYTEGFDRDDCEHWELRLPKK